MPCATAVSTADVMVEVNIAATPSAIFAYAGSAGPEMAIKGGVAVNSARSLCRERLNSCLSGAVSACEVAGAV